MFKLFRYNLPKYVVAFIFSSLIVFIIGFLFRFGGLLFDVSFGLSAIWSGGYMITLIDQYNKDLSTQKLFPLSDREVVGLRYMSCALCFFVWFVAAGVLSAYYAANDIWALHGERWLSYTVSMLDVIIAAGVMYSLFIPLSYFAEDKKRMVKRLILIPAFVASYLLLHIIYFYQAINRIDLSKTLHNWIILAVLSLALWAVSFPISVKLYRRAEL